MLVRSTERRSRFPPLRSGRTDFFRDFDEFYIPTECSGINLFRNTIAVSSSRGIEILQLDRKQSVDMDEFLKIVELKHWQEIENNFAP